MKTFVLLLITFALHAEDHCPSVITSTNTGAIPADCTKPAPLATVEQLTTKVAEQQKESMAKDQTIAYLQRKLQMYQQGLFACQDAQIDAQAKAKEKAK